MNSSSDIYSPLNAQTWRTLQALAAHEDLVV